MEYDQSLKMVLDAFRSYNVTLNPNKSSLKVQELQFLENILSTSGIKPDPDKVNTVLNFRA